MVRKLGGFTFQELNLTLDDHARHVAAAARTCPTTSSRARPTTTRCSTGDAGFLRLVLQLMRKYEHRPGRADPRAAEPRRADPGARRTSGRARRRAVPVPGQQLSGKRAARHGARRDVRAADRRQRALQPASSATASRARPPRSSRRHARHPRSHARSSRRTSSRSSACTCCSRCTTPCSRACSRCRAGTWSARSPCRQTRCATRLADGDTRWINRGAYDLLGSNPAATRSAAGLPRAVALYGSLPQQLQDPDSFASQLARLLKARAALHLYAARLSDVPDVQAKGLFVLVHELPDNGGLEVTAINFGAQAVDESVVIHGAGAACQCDRRTRSGIARAELAHRRRPAPAPQWIRSQGAAHQGLTCAAPALGRPRRGTGHRSRRCDRRRQPGRLGQHVHRHRQRWRRRLGLRRHHAVRHHALRHDQLDRADPPEQDQRHLLRVRRHHISGFIGTHQPAIWMGDYGYVTLMPRDRRPSSTTPRDRQPAVLARATRSATPYYYAVSLDAGRRRTASAPR